jgi:outer membrane lipoprotein
MLWRWLTGITSLLACVACSAVISPPVRALVDPTLTYTQLTAHPEAYRGKVILVAGTIIEAVNTPAGTRLMVLQYPADSRSYPQTAAPSGGRFLVLTPAYLETAIYRPGRALTVAGEVQGQRALPVGEIVYHYPLLTPREMYLWPEGGAYPQVHFGFGFGFSRSF